MSRAKKDNRPLCPMKCTNSKGIRGRITIRNYINSDGKPYSYGECDVCCMRYTEADLKNIT